MARAADTAANNANTQYTAAATAALKNANSSDAAGNDQISSLEANNPYDSTAAKQSVNLIASGDMNSTDTAGAQELNDAALRTGTNTAALGRTIASNNRAGQRQMDMSVAGQTANNLDKSVNLKQGLIQDRNQAAQTQGNLYATSAGGQGTAEGNLTTLQGQNSQMWGNIIGGAAGAAGSAFAGAGKGI